MPQTTIREVARAAGVSIGSASDILSGSPRSSYRADTIQRVKAAAAETGYRPDALARSLRRGRTNFVAITLGAGGSPMLSALVVHIRAALAAHGFQPVLADLAGLASDGLQAGDLAPSNLAGIISADLAFETTPLPAALLDACPVVTVYPTSNTNIDCVTTDRARAMEMAVAHLVELGHRRIAFTCLSDDAHPTNAPKLRGWRSAKARYGIDADGRYTIPVPREFANPRTRGDYVADAIAALKPTPSALVATSDDIALSASGVLTGRGWRLPENLSMVGFDGVFYAEYVWPPLTTLAQPLKRVAEQASARLKLLVDARGAGSPLPPTCTLIEPELIVRNSTLPVAAWKEPRSAG